VSLRARLARLQRGANAAGHCWRCGGEHAPDLARLQERLRQARREGRVLLCDCPCCWPCTSVVAEAMQDLKRRG
jgi:hypothetical protein